MGIDVPTAEELFIKYGKHVLGTRTSLFEMLFILKNDPSWDNVSWSVHSAQGAKAAGTNFWDRLQFFDQVLVIGNAPSHKSSMKFTGMTD